MLEKHRATSEERAFPVCKWCKKESIMKQGRIWLCVKHYRFQQMRCNAKRHGKTVPTYSELELMLSGLMDMQCQLCKQKMNWRSIDGQSTVISLQHWRSGGFGLLCRSCNTRHAFRPGDSFEYSEFEKHCPGCSQLKPVGEFYTDKRGRWSNTKTYCKGCSDERCKAWVRANRDRYNEYQRMARTRRKANSNPVSSGA